MRLTFTILAITFATIHCLGQGFGVHKTEFSIETDPTAFLMKGYSFHVRVKPASWGKVLLGAGTYGLDFPEMIADLNPDNRDEGWKPRIRTAYAMFGEYYFKEVNNRWFIGEQIGVQNFRVKNDREQLSGSADFSNVLLMTYFGYSWHPYKGAFYVKPWAGLGYTSKIDGITTVGSLRYDVAPLFPFFTFHLGYTFR
jgi:hypothetical protein